MNKQALDKLKPEKRKRIINSAFNEFSKNTYDKVSVFQIAKNANISRASFYCYFDDKKDVYLYLLMGLRDEIFNNLKIDKTNVDPFDFTLSMFKELVTFKGTDKQEFVEKMLKNLSPICNNVFITSKPNCKMKIKFCINNYKIKSEYEFLTLFDMLFYGLCRKLSLYYNSSMSKKKITEEFERIIYYAKYGVIAEGK